MRLPFIKIIIERTKYGRTYEDIAKKYNTSRQRIHQIYKNKDKYLAKYHYLLKRKKAIEGELEQLLTTKR